MEVLRTEIDIDPEIKELVPGFCKARQKDIQNISLLLNKNDFFSVGKICHSIKGVARPYGFPTLETLSRQLEEAAKAKDASLSLQILNQMNDFMKPYCF